MIDDVFFKRFRLFVKKFVNAFAKDGEIEDFIEENFSRQFQTKSSWFQTQSGLFSEDGNKVNLLSTFKTPSLFDFDYKLLKESVYRFYNKNIYLYEFDSTKEQKHNVLPLDDKPEFAHYMWFIQALAELNEEAFNKNYLNNPKLDIFINKIKTKLDYFSSFGKIEKLGAGIDGVAFSLGSNLVVKIFTNVALYKEYQKSQDKIFSGDEFANHETMIYDVGTLGVFNNKNIFFVVLEKVTPVTSLDEQDTIYEITQEITNLIYDLKMADLIKSYRVYLPSKKLKEKISKEIEIANDLYKSSPYKEIKIEKIKEKYSTYLKENKEKILEMLDEQSEIVMNHFLSDKYNVQKKRSLEDALNLDEARNMLKSKQDWLKKYIQQIMYKFLTERGDLHIGNLGLTNTNILQHFDPFHENHKDKINV